MTTFKVSVKDSEDANLLIKLLRRMTFVQNVEEIEKDNNHSQSFNKLKDFLESNADHNFFKDIKDPRDWQKGLRNEWE